MAKTDESARSRWNLNAFVLALVASIVAVSYWQFGDALSVANLARQESQLRTFQDLLPEFVHGIAFLVVVTGLSLPEATVLTLAYGWYFGLVRGVTVASLSSSAGIAGDVGPARAGPDGTRFP